MQPLPCIWPEPGRVRGARRPRCARCGLIFRIRTQGARRGDGFLGSREQAQRRQIKAGRSDKGERPALILPGYFRPTKLWDLLVIHQAQLVAALELKSQARPSFGNNFNHRAEEAIGTAHDLWTAYREGAFGSQPRPFVGWMTLVEDAPASRAVVRCDLPHFSVFAELQGASYLRRYDLFCQRLVSERLYTSAALMTSPRNAATTGAFDSLSEMTSLKAFVAALAGHVVSEASRRA